MNAPSSLPAVLVVEDNPITRKMLRVALAAGGYRVLEAGDGRSALAIMSHERPVVAVLDLILPDMHGFQLLSALRALPGNEDLAVLACTGFLPEGEEARAAASGFAEILIKPVEPSRLIRTVDVYARRAPARQAAVPAVNGTAKRVLLASDDPVQMKLSKLELESHGFTVTTASDGAAALAAAKASRPDAVVSDVLIPEMDGFKLCLAIRKAPELAGTAVVLQSSYFVEPADRALSVKVGASAYIERVGHGMDVAEAVEAAFAAPGLPPFEDVIRETSSEYMERIVHQLERQAAANRELVRRLGPLELALSMLGSVSESLALHGPADGALSEALYRCVDAAGISLGALYVRNEREVLTLHPGSCPAAEREAADFFGHPELIDLALRTPGGVRIPASDLPAPATEDFIRRLGRKTAALLPITFLGEPIGVLLFATDAQPGVGNDDWIALGEFLSTHLAQALALKRSFAAARLLNAELEQRVSERTEELEAFAYSVSHDLRGPLRALSGFSAALLEDYADKLDERGSGYLQHISAASREMALLIDAILQLSRLSRAEISRETVDVTGVANEIVGELRDAEPDREVRFTVQDGIVATADEGLLKVVLRNLLGNAWKFTARAPAATIEFGSEETDGERGYFVRDNGAGFDMAYARKLFAPFQRLHSQAEFPGTGIGLATVQRVVHRHGGRVWAEGAIDRGATFHFTLSTKGLKR